jgi:hypothetical protein
MHSAKKEKDMKMKDSLANRTATDRQLSPFETAVITRLRSLGSAYIVFFSGLLDHGRGCTSCGAVTFERTFVS